jgi:hypothetical protein
VKPARRSKGPRPRARSSAVQQAAIWQRITAEQEWDCPGIAVATGVPLSTVQHYVVALERGGYVRRVSPMKQTQAGGEPIRWRTHRKSRRLVDPPIVTEATRAARPQGEPTP